MNKATLIMTAILTMASFQAQAMEQDTYSMEMKNGGFAPRTLEVPAHKKIRLNIKNSESVQTEFESYSLNQEQKIESGDSAEMYIGPLDPGEYPVFDDNNPDAQGSLIAR